MDEDLKTQKTWRTQLVLDREHLENFESVKEVVRRRMNFIWRSVEREKNSSTKLGVAFSNRDDEKKLFKRFHSRVVSDHVYQQ